jgi:hypothetical protein
LFNHCSLIIGLSHAPVILYLNTAALLIKSPPNSFTYEHIKTQVRLKNAVAKIEDFNLKALSGNIVLTGQSHIT